MPDRPNPPPRDGWIAARAARATVRRFVEAWREVPKAAWHRWLWTLLFGWIAGAAITAAVTLAARAAEDAGRLAWEAAWLARFEREAPFSFSTALWMEAPGNSVFMIPVIVCAALAFVWARRPLTALSVLASFFMLDLLVLEGWTIWNRARPDVIAGGLASPGLHAFPSGHVAQMVSAYGFLAWLWTRHSPAVAEKLFAIALVAAGTVLVAAARLRLGAHWPSDIAAGALVGAIWLTVMIVAVRGAERAAR